MGSKKEPVILPQENISASDIERYGYCPMSWWLKKEGAREEDDHKLIEGTEKHRQIGKDISKIKKHEEERKQYDINIGIFAFAAIMLGLNGVAIIYPAQVTKNQEDIASILLLGISIFWFISAIILFLWGIRYELKKRGSVRGSQDTEGGDLPIKEDLKVDQGGSGDHEELKGERSKKFRESAAWFTIIATILAFNGYIIIRPPVEVEILSRILLILALLWLMATSVALFFLLRREQHLRLHPEKSSAEEKGGLLRMSKYERIIIWFSVVAAVLAINGLTIERRPGDAIGTILFILAGLWVYASFLFMFMAFRSGFRSGGVLKVLSLRDTGTKPTRKMDPEVIEELQGYKNSALVVAAIASMLGLNSFLIEFGPSHEWGHIFEIVALSWLIGASLFLYRSIQSTQSAKRLRDLHEVVDGTVAYSDTLEEGTPMLRSKKFHLHGRPDYIIKREDVFIPVEIKTGKIPKGPYFSHILQIAAYCVLVEDTYGVRPPNGILKYTDGPKHGEHKIDYTDELKVLLISKLQEMRYDIKMGGAKRNHNRPGKCRSCSRRNECPDSLVKEWSKAKSGKVDQAA